MLDRRRFLTLLVAAGGALSVPLRPARAAASGLTGDFEQGGMIVGRTEPGARVWLDGAPIRVSPEGLYVFGFGRDQGASAALKIELPGREPQTETLAIVQREYKIQRIDGLPGDKVTPVK